MRFIIFVLLLAVGVVLGFLVYVSVTDYRPAVVEPVDVAGKVSSNAKPLRSGDTISLVAFNTGYCGLDKDEDFFMDGGTMSRASSATQATANLRAIVRFLQNDTADLYALQEVDTGSSRSYGVNQLGAYRTAFPGYTSGYAVNYRVAWVPVPLAHPMGKANSGLLTLSGYPIAKAQRFQYPGEESWPTRLFELDRCLLETRIDVEGGQQLVLINSHLSAFDKGGEIRKQQLAFLKEKLEKEAATGNYVVVAGDWNHELPGTDPAKFPAKEAWPFWLQPLPSDFNPPGYVWAVDPNAPTVRTDATRYQKGENFRAIIDGFLVSKNIQVVSVNTTDLDFANSDHNPVRLVFKLTAR